MSEAKPASKCYALKCSRPAFEWPEIPRPCCLHHAKKFGKSRFGVVRQKGGRSQSEADYAVWLDLSQHVKGPGQVRNIQREVWYELRLEGQKAIRNWKFQEPRDERGTLVCRYYLDFWFEQKGDDGKWRQRWVDKKAGLMTRTFVEKARWMKEIYGIEIETPDDTKRWKP